MQQELFASAASTAVRSRNETNFVDNMKLPIHRWFRFSAGYSAEWVERLVLNYRVTSDVESPVVLDPFAGSGTTLLASSAQGARSYGWESQPFIFRVARAKVGSINVDPLDLYKAGRIVLDKAAADGRTNSRQEHPLLLRCYSADVLCDLRSIQRGIELVSLAVSQEVADLLWLAFVSILRPASHAGTAQWQYVQPNKVKTRTTCPVAGFKKTINVMADDISTIHGHLAHSMSISLHDARIASDLAPDLVDVVVTSPPYANNFDYADATRLEMTFLGEIENWSDLKSLRESLIHACSQHMAGYDCIEALNSPLMDPIRSDLEPIYEQLEAVRHTRGGKKAYHAMVVGYFLDMAMVWMNLRRTVRTGGTAYFVIGDSAPYGVYVPVDSLLGELAVAAGFKEFSFTKSRDRNTKWKNRKHRVPLKEGVLEVQG